MELSKSERDHRYMKNRRRLGLCGTNGCPNKSGDSFYCDDCKADLRARIQARRDRERKGSEA